MFDHVKFGVSDYAASKAFFLKALEPLGVTVASEGTPTYGVELSSEGTASLCLYQTEEKPAHLHLAFTAENRAQVEAFHRAAMEAGGKDNGAPGLRPHYHANYRLRETGATPIATGSHRCGSLVHARAGLGAASRRSLQVAAWTRPTRRRGKQSNQAAARVTTKYSQRAGLSHPKEECDVDHAAGIRMRPACAAVAFLTQRRPPKASASAAPCSGPVRFDRHVRLQHVRPGCIDNTAAGQLHLP